MVGDRRSPFCFSDVVDLSGLNHIRDRIVDAGGHPVVRPMSSELLATIVMKRNLVVFGQLERQPQSVVGDVLIVHRLGTIRSEGVAQIIVRAPTSDSVEKPNAVPLDRTAQSGIDIVKTLDGIFFLEAKRLK